MDPLDSGDSITKAWEQFRARYSSALILHWLGQDLEEIYPDYVMNLWGRLQTGFAYKDALEELGDYDGAVPVHTPDGDDVAFWIDYDELGELFEALFPHFGETTQVEDATRRMALIGLHSAFEYFLKELGLEVRSVPSAVKKFLERHGYPLDAEQFLRLVDLDATRHILVHNGGVVDDRYIRAVYDSKYHVGEFRTVSVEDVDLFDKVLRKVALRIKSVAILSA